MFSLGPDDFCFIHALQDIFRCDFVKKGEEEKESGESSKKENWT